MEGQVGERWHRQANCLGALWFPWRYCFDPNNELISQIGFSKFEEAVRVKHPFPMFVGKLQVS